MESVSVTLYGEILPDSAEQTPSHYPKYAMQEARSGSVDAALYGHTHQAVREMYRGCLLANPGELQGRTGRIGFGILDTDSRIMNLHSLDFNA